MNLIDKKVRHLTFGVGKITEQDNSFIIVEFVSKSTKFQYPEAFSKFLELEDANIHAEVLKVIEEVKAAAEEKKRLEDDVIKIAEKQKSADELTEHSINPHQKPLKRQPIIKQDRISGKRMTFFVFQGATFDKEYRGGYIWAPISNKAGRTNHHWDRLLDVRPGDIILHGFDGYVQAISTAKDVCYEVPQPEELRVEDLWDTDGRMVDCDYIYIDHPIRTSTFINDILRLCTVKYSPFNKYGTGNMGYLYELNRELARIFIRASVEKNPRLRSVDYIQELLAD